MMPSMDYAEARDAFFQPRSDDAPAAGTDDWDAMPGRRLRHVLEPLATINFWSEPAVAAYEKVGLDFLGGYVLARGSVLGDAEGAVVASAFGTFQPDVIAALWAGAREACDLDAIRGARRDGAVTALREVLGDAPEGLADVVGALHRAAGVVTTVGHPLSAGLAAAPWPDEPLAALWHGATLLRENRGECHLSACAVAGLDGLEANLLTERRVGWAPTAYAGSRAWSPEEMEAATRRLADRSLLGGDGLSAEGIELRDRLEEQTEEQQAGVLAAIGDDLDLVVERCGAWSDQVLAHGWFPPDAYKRAAG